jgi:predicted GNAT family N-acyltransferase
MSNTGTCNPDFITSRVANTEADRRAAYRLRYDVYVAEQGKPYPEADHRRRLLTDELDPEGETIVIAAGQKVIATVRANWFDSAATMARYRDVFELSRFPSVLPSQIAVCSRLAASVEYRDATARQKLFEAIYEIGITRDTKLCFATCTSVLARLFRAYGFREYADTISDPVVGKLHRTVLHLDDIEYLERIRSPFVVVANNLRREMGNSMISAYKKSHLMVPCAYV